MMTWMVIISILTLALGLSVGGLVLGYRQGLWNNIVRYLFMGLLGVVIATILMVLTIIAFWPPYDTLSVMLPIAFIVLLVGGIYFVQNTAAEQGEDYIFFKSEKNIL